MHFYPRAKEVSVSMWCAIVLVDAGFQLDDVSVCCVVSVKLVQGCEWHWQIFGEAPYRTSFLSDSSLQFLQTCTHANSPRYSHSPGRLSYHLGLPSFGPSKPWWAWETMPELEILKVCYYLYALIDFSDTFSYVWCLHKIVSFDVSVIWTAF